MKRLLAVVLTVALVISLAGCNLSLTGGDLIPLSKPEDAVTALLDPDNLSAFLDELIKNNSYLAKTGELGIYDRLFSDIGSLPAWEKFLRDNVKHIEYDISDVAIRDDTASVSTIITYYDLTPVVEKSFDLLYDKIMSSDELFSGDDELDENAVFDLLSDFFYDSFLEALKTTKTPETSAKIRFKCVKESGRWEIDDIPEEFAESVLFGNISESLSEYASSFSERFE